MSRFEQGTSSKFDLLQSKVQVALLIPQLIKSRNAIDLIAAELKKLLGFKQEDPIKLKGAELQYFLIDIREDEFLQTAYL